MGMAFGIGVEDVVTVVSNKLGLNLSEGEDLTEEIFAMLDDGKVECAALSEDDMDAQTEAAYQEIWKQISSNCEVMQKLAAEKGLQE